MRQKTRVAFQTNDGVTLRGDFLQAEGEARPIVVMTAGFPLLKEHYIGAVAERFQAAGVSALAYDYRGFGSSDGVPRFESSLLQQGEDYRDAVTAAARLPGVEPGKVVLYGVGHAGAGAIIAAANDPRVAGVILQSPAISGRHDRTIFGEAIIERAWRSREERTSAGRSAPDYVRFWPESLEEARDPNSATVLHGEGPFQFLSEGLRASSAAGTPWENKISLQSLLNVVGTEARDFLPRIKAPTLYAVIPDDPFTGTAAFHRAAFDTMGSNGAFVVVEPVPAASITETLWSSFGAHELAFLRRIADGA